ncbi:MAG TPA: hypothetical protein VMX17_05460 [Candidatus Glassbacteria bacterium]|nr:hypothetical protein [Candidatus Glassbacteria bacterium]
MKQILVLNSEKEVIKKQPIDRELIWYDHEKKEMQKFNGGKLAFEYGFDKDLQKHRMLPKVEELFENKKEKTIDKNSASTWFELYSRYNDTSATVAASVERGIIFSVEENELEDFLYDLERQDINFEVDYA